MPSPISKVIESVIAVKARVMGEQAHDSDFVVDNRELSTDIATEISTSETATPETATSKKTTSEKTTGQLRRRVTWKRVLYHPLTWLAVGLHVALLVVPFDPAPPIAVEPEEDVEPEDEAIPIDLLNLSEIATSEPPPAEPLPAEPPAPQQAPPVAPPPAAQAPQPDPVQSNPDPAQQTPEATTQPTQAPTQPPPPAYDPSADQQLFVQNLGAIGLNTYNLDAIGLPAARDFKEPANAPYFLNGETPVPNARSVQQIDKEPGDVFEQVQSSYASTGITFTQELAYGGEELYHAVTPEGQTLMYFSLVRLKGSTLLVIWNGQPV
ncbi:MAG: hypothetical protein AAF703_21095 [Cyanobacteria bacterium P01_D01_bin.105]